ncbi:hypothetical protein G6F46_014740 [Rhizopus delemar]|nr:hypothetical protein G6F46_014740 [Rhizopus delemar]
MKSPQPSPIRRKPLWQAASLIAAAASLAGCAPMPTGGSSALPTLGNVFKSGLSFSPSVNVAKNMEGRSINDAIAALGEPSRTRTPAGCRHDPRHQHHRRHPRLPYQHDRPLPEPVACL